jgi:DNA-binding Lrp family transcriptional regulator
VIRDLADGRQRFGELERSLEGISPRTLSLRLRSLEEEGIVARQTFPEVPPRVEYELTERAARSSRSSSRCASTAPSGSAPPAFASRRQRPPSRSLSTPSGLQVRIRARGGRLAAQNPQRMHNRALHDTLAAFVEEAAWQLAEEVAAGAEVPFELIEQGRASAPLYCYRPLTDRFIAEHLGMLERPALLPGRAAVAAGAAQPRRLPDRARPPRARRRSPRSGRRRARGVHHRPVGRRHRLRLRPRALRSGVQRARGGGLRRLLAVGRARARRGARDRRRGGRAGDGLALVRGSTLLNTPTDLHGDDYATIAVLHLESTPGESPALEQAGRRLRRLQTALRLWDDAEPSLAPVAWARTDGGPWMSVPLATGLRRMTGDCLLAPEEEDPLRAFCALIARRTPRAGELAWALRRFELGCERSSPWEAISDWLLSARALLGAPATSAVRAARRDLRRAEDASALARPPARHVSLERAAIAGSSPDPGSRRSSRSSARTARDPARRALRPPRPALRRSPTAARASSRRLDAPLVLRTDGSHLREPVDVVHVVLELGDDDRRRVAELRARCSIAAGRARRARPARAPRSPPARRAPRRARRQLGRQLAVAPRRVHAVDDHAAERHPRLAELAVEEDRLLDRVVLR